MECLYKTVEDFSPASGLKANLNKSCLYLEGVNIDIAQSIRDSMGMDTSNLPYYLDIRLHSKQLRAMECNMFLIKLLGKLGIGPLVSYLM